MKLGCQRNYYYGRADIRHYELTNPRANLRIAFVSSSSGDHGGDCIYICIWQVCVRLLLVASLVPGLTITQVTARQVRYYHFQHFLYNLVYLQSYRIILISFLKLWCV